MKLFRNFSIILFSTIVEKGIGFFILPLISLKIMPENLGILALIISTYSFLFPLILVNSNGALFVEYFKKESNLPFGEYLSNALFINLFLFLFFFVSFFFAADFLTDFFNCPKEWILAIPIFCYLESIKATAASLLQIQKKALQYAFFNLTYSIINFTTSLLFVYSFSWDYQGRLAGLLLSGFVIAIVSLVIFYRLKLLKLKVSKAAIIDILKYGAPLIPHSIGFLVLDMSDRYFINHFNGKSEVGIYSLSYLLGSVIYILAGAFSISWIPFLYEELKKGTSESLKKVVKISSLFILSMAVISGLYIAALPLAYKYVIGSAYSDGLNYCFIIVLGYFFMCIYLVFANVIFYEKKNYYFGAISVVNIAANVTLNYFFIRSWGATGAAIATCLSMAAFMMIVAYFSNRLRPLPWYAGLREMILSGKSFLKK